MNAGKGIKVIVSMIGLDGHSTGAEVVSMILRDAGMEVIYLGNNQTPEMIAHAAIQEDVDVVGISSHAMNYDQIEELVALLREKGLGDVLVLCGGNIPRQQAQKLKEKGVAEVFPPGSSSESMISFIVNQVGTKRSGSAAATT